MTIIEFLLARIAEDEEQARRGPGPLSEDWQVVARWREAAAARVLAECQAKRAIIALHTYEWMGPDDAAGKGCEHDYEDWPCTTLRHLAAVYADHPDYQPEWRP